jgi:hypothetical protein
MTSVVQGATLSLPLKVTYRTLNWQELVVREWGTEWGRPDIAYEFSNGRTADCTDQYRGGIYDVSYGFRLLLDPLSNHTDMYQYGLLLDTGGAIDID